MCSISGFYKLSEDSIEEKDFFINAFTEMSHRGPDFERVLPVSQKCSLGHQRLSIIDVKEVSHQPMKIRDSFLSYNGEIYNYKELKGDLKKDGASFSTDSDTEVLLVGLEREGIKFLNKLNGMFAFAYYQKDADSLWLVRDRFGVKPLYYMIQENTLYFSSELKPLINIKSKPLKRNNDYYKNFIEHTSTDSNKDTFVDGIYQLRKGTYLKISKSIDEKVWYRGQDFIFDRSIFLDKKKTLDFAEDLILDSISKRLRADVPICLTLSGGIDSTTIYTLIKERLKKEVQLFTFSLPGSPSDETKKAIQLAESYKDRVTIIKDDDIPDLHKVNEDIRNVEFPIWSISTRAYKKMYQSISKKGFRVVLEGHGSDEQLGGYPHMIDSAIYDDIYSLKFLSAYKTYNIKKATETKPTSTKGNHLVGFILTVLRSIRKSREIKSFQEMINWTFNFKTLPIVLRAFDRLSMLYSVESRAPFMDYRLVEFFEALPRQYKISNIGNKAVLREILKKYNKKFIYEDKSKQGFASDIDLFFSRPEIRNTSKDIISTYDNSSIQYQIDESLNYLAENEQDHERDFSMIKVLLLAMNDQLFNIK